MNTIIEPCCYAKQLTHNLEESEKGSGVFHFFSFSDWGADELVPWVLSSVPGCEASVCLVQIDFRSIYMLAEIMKRTYVSDRSSGKVDYVVKHLCVITQTSRIDPEKQRMEFRAQLGKFIDEGRLTVCEDNIGFRCITAGNGCRHIVVNGSLNQGHMEPCCQMYTMTTTKGAYIQAMEMISSKSRTRKIKV